MTQGISEGDGREQLKQKGGVAFLNKKACLIFVKCDVLECDCG